MARILEDGPVRRFLRERSGQSFAQMGLAAELFWKEIDALIKDEQEADKKYSKLAQEAERLHLPGALFIQIASDEGGHRLFLEQYKTNYKR